MSFLTVEDVNSVLLNYGNINEFYVLDTSKIPFTANDNNFSYDFVNIWRENGFYFLNVSNSLWTGGYYITDENDNMILNANLRYDRFRFSYIIEGLAYSSSPSFKIHFYLCNYFEEFNLTQLSAKVTNLRNFSVRYNDYFEYEFDFASLTEELSIENANVTVKIGSETYSKTVNEYGYVYIMSDTPLTESCNCSIQIRDAIYYFFINVFKDNLIFDLEGDLLVGAVNTVNIIADDDADLTGVTGSVNVNGLVQDLNFEYGAFTVDLTGETVAKEVSIIITVHENRNFYGYTHEFKLNSHYFQPSSFGELKRELENVTGAPIIELTSDLVFNNVLTVNHDVLIRSSDDSYLLNLRNAYLIINENISFKIDNTEIRNGNPFIIQKNSSKVEITNCKIGSCVHNNANGLGSVIYCDIGANSLDQDNDFYTSIINTEFTNVQSAIFHAGQLTVDKCKFRRTSLNSTNDNPSFLYQVNGDATITSSIFDIDSTSNTMCRRNKNVGFNQCLVMCGESATINGANHDYLQADNSLPFFDTPYNNKSHLFVKYFYSSIDDCVFSSPVEDFEDKSCCHAVSGVDWIFKDNIQITRESWVTENKKRIITW